MKMKEVYKFILVALATIVILTVIAFVIAKYVPSNITYPSMPFSPFSW